MRFLLSNLVSVGLVFSLLLLPIHFIFLTISLSGYYSIAAALLLLVLMWWLSGGIYDSVFRRHYGVKWISMKSFESQNYALALYLQDQLQKHGLRIQKLGVIDDDRPICATYGEGKNSIRLIISNGVMRNLNEKEMQAVIAHELGHMHSGDFPVFSTAYLPAFLLYLPAKLFWRGEKKIWPLMPLGVGFYFLHLAFSIPVMLQSRLREYFADEFACENADPNALGSALCKISLAFISQSSRRKSLNFMEAARPFSIIDFKMSRNLALAYLNFKGTGSWVLAENIVLQDLYNPWPAFFEMNSTHPLLGKRLIFICLKNERLGGTPFLDMQRMFALKTDNPMLRLNFIEDFIIYFIARFSPLVILLLFLSGYFHDKSFTLGVMTVLYGLGVALLSLYSFSYVQFKDRSIKEQLEDAFVSPIRGRPLILNGVIREKSSLGLDLPEELIFADHSGEIFIGPRSLMPLVISPYISAGKLMKLKDRRVRVKGWYLRGKYPKLIIDEVSGENQNLKGRQRLFDLGLACLVVSAGLLLMMV
ncbi:MAG TPA: M48 family metalloprotease [Candidatus Norongarragalinales archaeon]|nr:M48 family metalloprotease [Candidatus Norongarragalinales archaeon]